MLSSVFLVLSVSLSLLLKTSCLAVSQVGMFVVAGVIVGGFAVFVVVVVVVLAGVVVVVVVAGLLAGVVVGRLFRHRPYLFHMALCLVIDVGVVVVGVEVGPGVVVAMEVVVEMEVVVLLMVVL